MLSSSWGSLAVGGGGRWQRSTVTASAGEGAAAPATGLQKARAPRGKQTQSPRALGRGRGGLPTLTAPTGCRAGREVKKEPRGLVTGPVFQVFLQSLLGWRGVLFSLCGRWMVTRPAGPAPWSEQAVGGMTKERRGSQTRAGTRYPLDTGHSARSPGYQSGGPPGGSAADSEGR